MTNLLQDPSVLIYDSLFFGLTLGNYNLHVSTESGLLEEFLIIREEYFNQLGLLENILPKLMKNPDHAVTCESQKQFYTSSGLIIDFIIYSDLRNNEIIGLGLRIRASDRLALAFLGVSWENRIQKIMFLLSRGLLKSSFHQISQKAIVLELD